MKKRHLKKQVYYILFFIIGLVLLLILKKDGVFTCVSGGVKITINFIHIIKYIIIYEILKKCIKKIF